jgi:hypothetical protein
MARKYKLDPTSRNQIARAYRAGMGASEIAKDYGVSPSYVINTAKAWETEQSLRRLKTLEKHFRQQIVPPPIEMPETGQCRFTRAGNAYSLNAHGISLPFVPIQHGARK